MARRARNLRSDWTSTPALVLGIGGRRERATGLLQALLARADERALMRLTPRTLSDLAVLNEELRVDFPSTALRELAAELMPPKSEMRLL